MTEPAIQAAYGLVAIPARFALERRQWAEAAALVLPAKLGVDWEAFPHIAAIHAYAQAVGAARTGDLPATLPHRRSRAPRRRRSGSRCQPR